MTLLRYEPNRRGLKAILGSEGVLADLILRGEAVAAAARAEYTARPPHQGHVDVEVVAESGHGTRVRDRVAVIAHHPGALPIEHNRRPLGAALDAARLL